MRAYLKNDNFFLATKKDQQKKKKQLEQKQLQKQLKQKEYQKRKTMAKNKKQNHVQSTEVDKEKEQNQIKKKEIIKQTFIEPNKNFKFKINSSQNHIEDDLKEFLNQAKIKKQNNLIRENGIIKNINSQLQKQQSNNQQTQNEIMKKSVKNIFSRAFIPKSTIKTVVPQITQNKILEKKDIQWQRKKQEKKLKQQIEAFTKNNQKQQQRQKQKTQNEIQNKIVLQEQSNNQLQKKPKKQKQKKIKRVTNYQKLDLKRKYKDQFLGGLRRNQRNYTPNGRFKQKFKAQSQLSIQDGQVYNSFVSSLSRALHVNLYLDDDSQEDDQMLDYQIPQIINQPNLQKFIRDLFGFQSFREGQYQVIENTLNNKSTIFISQTASGKSLTYIVSSIIMGAKQGMSIVISPLIALMLDQLEHLPIDLPAACISSLLNYQQRSKIVTLVKQNKIKLLFMTPQTLQSDLLFHIKQFPAVNFVCIDEAHCLSELSHNFRTSYLALAEIIKHQIQYVNQTPTILCLTATANIQTIKSLQEKLKIQKVIKSSCTINKNLYITISRQSDTQTKSKSLVTYLNQKQIKKCRGVLVYCRTRWLIDKVFNYLTNSNINSRIYHGALTNKQKTEIISSFRDQKIKVILTTTALGMGLDFQHLDCVVHFNMPKSIQSYIQEIGRAGRRCSRAYCHLFLDQNDYLMQRNYILADQLENQSLKILLKQMQKNMNPKVNKQKKKNKAQTKKQRNMQSVIKRIALQIQKMEQQQDSQQSQNQHQSQNCSKISYQSDNQKELSNQAKLYYVKVKQLTQKSYLREQTLLTVLIKIQNLISKKYSEEFKEDMFRVLPLSYQVLKLSFFKTNQQQLKQESQFYNILIQKNCKKIGKCYHIHIIQKCNQLKITPIELLQKVYKISCEYVIKVEFISQIYIWQVNENLNIRKLFELMQSKQFQNKLIDEVNSIQTTSISKLNVFYSLAFDFARITMDNIVQKKLLICRQTPLPQQNIMNKFDQYFNTELNKFYQKITDGDQQAYLPTTLISNQDLIPIFDCVKGFFKHQFSNINERQNNRTLCKQKIINEFRDGKIISRVLMGVNETKTNWKIYGQHNYWKKFIGKNYHQLLSTVRDLIKNNQEKLIQL